MLLCAAMGFKLAFRVACMRQTKVGYIISAEGYFLNERCNRAMKDKIKVGLRDVPCKHFNYLKIMSHGEMRCLLW